MFDAQHGPVQHPAQLGASGYPIEEVYISALNMFIHESGWRVSCQCWHSERNEKLSTLCLERCDPLIQTPAPVCFESFLSGDDDNN